MPKPTDCQAPLVRNSMWTIQLICAIWNGITFRNLLNFIFLLGCFVPKFAPVKHLLKRLDGLVSCLCRSVLLTTINRQLNKIYVRPSGSQVGTIVIWQRLGAATVNEWSHRGNKALNPYYTVYFSSYIIHVTIVTVFLLIIGNDYKTPMTWLRLVFIYENGNSFLRKIVTMIIDVAVFSMGVNGCKGLYVNHAADLEMSTRAEKLNVLKQGDFDQSADQFWKALWMVRSK